MACIILHDESGLALAVALTSPATIGRDPQCDVVLGDAKVAQRHARLEERDGAWWLVDLGSRHGSSVDGQRIEAAALRSGAEVQLGGARLRFEAASPAPLISHVTRADEARARASGARDSLGSLLYFVAEAAQQLGDLDALLGRILDAAVATFGAARGAVALTSPGGGGLRRVAQVRGQAPQISSAIVDAVVRRRESVLVRTPAPELRTAMAAPLLAGDRVLGFLYLDVPGSSGGFDADDLTSLTALASLTGALVDSAVRFDRAAVAAEVALREGQASPLLGTSAPMLSLRRDIERLASTNQALHLRGESGSGKELVARALHAASSRASAPLVAVNCAALPDSLIESELFGHSRGAFNGAVEPRRGKLALADGGTLFLDEIAELSAAAQAKILRVLEDGEVVPVGGERGHLVDVRVLSASNKDLRAEVAAGRFREDLFTRLVVAEISVPPLRVRVEDIPRLAEAFLSSARTKGAAACGFSPEALAALSSHDWPGNVRELRNVVERAAALAAGSVIEVDDLRMRRDGRDGRDGRRGEGSALGTMPPLNAAPFLAAVEAAELSANTIEATLDELFDDRLGPGVSFDDPDDPPA